MASVTVARMAEQQRFLTRDEAAAYLRISTRYLDVETAAGRIPAIRLGRRVTYSRDDLEAYAASRKDTGPTRPAD